MFHARRLLLLSLVLMTSLLSLTSSQKVEKDDLDEDKYNLQQGKSENEVKDEHKRPKMKYVVTEEVYLDVEITSKNKSETPYQGRIVIACFGEIAPITCLNFISLAKGHSSGREYLTYANTPIHRIVRDFVVQMGDVTGKGGNSGTSIYGKTFKDENFILSNQGIGWVAMANYGKDTNASQFFILLQPARWLDGSHVVFGKVIKGMDVVRKLGNLQSSVTGKPKLNARIVKSGVHNIMTKYEMPIKDVTAEDDII